MRVRYTRFERTDFFVVVSLPVWASDVAKTQHRLLTTICRSGDDTGKRVN